MATLKDIADGVGVSIGTVDRIIHSRGRYSEKTAIKVRKAMKELNYTPNIHARGLKQTKKHIFGAVIPINEQDGGYWHLVEVGLLRAAQTLYSYSSEVKIFPYDRYSSSSCVNALTEAITLSVAGLLIAPTRPEDIKMQLASTNIPFVFIDSDIPELKGRTSFIGQDSYQSGILSGRLMSLLLSSKVKSKRDLSVLIVDPPGSNDHLKSRIEGFQKCMSGSMSQVNLVRIKEEVDDEKQVHEFLEEYWSDNAYLPDGIFVANSSVYYIASFLEIKGLDYSTIPLIGYDILPGRESVIEKGIIDFILTQQPEEQGYQGIMMLYDDIVLKKKIEKEVITPLNIITKENLHTFTNYRIN